MSCLKNVKTSTKLSWSFFLQRWFMAFVSFSFSHISCRYLIALFSANFEWIRVWKCQVYRAKRVVYQSPTSGYFPPLPDRSIPPLKLRDNSCKAPQPSFLVKAFVILIFFICISHSTNICHSSIPEGIDRYRRLRQRLVQRHAPASSEHETSHHLREQTL